MTGHRIVFVRHAESLANTIGSLDCAVPGPELSPEGFRQAGALVTDLPEDLEELPVRAIWASTMIRAQQTAQPLAEHLGLPVRVHPLLHEGDVGDLHARVDDEAHQALEDLFACWQMQGELERGAPNGETGHQLLGRLRSSVADVLADLGSDEPGAAVVISHGAILRLGLARLCDGVTPAYTLAHHLPNTARVVVDVLDPDDPPRLVCRSWAGMAR